MKKVIRWGILGTGNIAKKFAKSLSILPDTRLVAVGSRSEETAKTFADEFGVPHRHANYEALAEDANVDVVYVATPHPFHMDNSILCLMAGRAVLCEKPFTINAGQAEQVINVAKEAKLFLMEAMWTRFLPAIKKVKQWVQQGRIGDVCMLSADFGFRAVWNPQSRLFNPELGGGALLDIGVYCVSLASMIFGGPPSQIVSSAHLGETGVDEQSAMILGYGKGRMAILSCAVTTELATEARIYGTKGSVLIHTPWWRSTAVTISVGGKGKQVVNMPYEGNGYNYEAAEVMRCIRQGRLESDTMRLDETLSIMKTMDQIRAQWGLRYLTE